MLLLLALLLRPGHASAATREHRIQAEDVMWDVASDGGDPIMGATIPRAACPAPTIRANVGDVRREDAPGAWFRHCHVESRQDNGMAGLYRVSPR